MRFFQAKCLAPIRKPDAWRLSVKMHNYRIGDNLSLHKPSQMLNRPSVKFYLCCSDVFARSIKTDACVSMLL